MVDANPADYGAASFRAGDGCSAWIVESPFACLEWSAAIAVCAKVKKLAAAMRPSKPLTQSGSLPTRASMYAHEGVATEI